MLGHGTAPGTGHMEPDRGQMTGTTRAVATRQEVVRADTMGSTVITAEIPAVPVHRSYGVLLPDGSVWYPGSKRKLPAPWPLRFAVWVVAFVLVLMLIGLVIVELQPSWLASFRHTVGSAPTLTLPGGQTTEPTQQGGTGTTAAVAGTSTFKCVTAATPPAGHAGGETCTIGVSSYTIEFVTTAPCYVQVWPVNAPQAYLYSQTQPGGQTHSISASGATALVADAGGASIKILANGKQIGTTLPATFNWLYTFQPS
jgi:hypothetical protein